MAGLTVEQMEFLAARGLSLGDVIEFAKMSEKPKSKGAERIARWRAKKRGDVTESVTGNVTGNALPPPIEDHTPPISSNEENRRKPKQASPAKPEGVKDQTWRDFLHLRKQKRSPLTQTALDGIEREARKAGWSMETTLAKCLSRGWQGFEAEWVANSPGPPGSGSSDLVKTILAKQAAREPTQ